MQFLQRNTIIAICLAALSSALSGDAVAETALGTDIGTRLILAFDVNDEAAAAWLPEGTKLVQVGRGPFQGADMLLVMNDWTLRTDPDGNVQDSSGHRGVVVAGFGVPAGAEKPRLFVMRVYSSDPNSNPYKVSLPAKIAHSTAIDAPAEGVATRTEAWRVEPESGGQIEVSLKHEIGTANWSSGKSIPFSVAEPDLHRIYQWSQLAEVAMSDGMGMGLKGDITITAEIDELSAAFDGSERLLAVVALPTYYRETFEP